MNAKKSNEEAWKTTARGRRRRPYANTGHNKNTRCRNMPKLRTAPARWPLLQSGKRHGHRCSRE
eukprot:8697426-Lingulodinium_polyedra.AAC.1